MSVKISETRVLTNNIGPSYVSSNSYYGYVPPISQFTQNPNISLNNASGVCVKDNHHSTHSSGFTINGVLEGRPLHRYQQDYYSDNTMEMDTDDCSGMGMCCQNNHYVIPEMVNGGKEVDDSMTYHQTNGNRKRTCGDEQMHCGRLTGTVKRFKSDSGSRFRGGGNSRVNHGTTSPRESRSSQVHNESSSLYITPHTLTLTWHSMSTDDCCTLAAGKSNNYHFINNEIIDYERVSDRFISLCGNEYENMLMETHGCTLYHHQRQLEFDNGTVETEF